VIVSRLLSLRKRNSVKNYTGGDNIKSCKFCYYIFCKGDFNMKNIMNPVRSKKAVFQNNRYRHGKARNQMFGRHDILKRFDVTEKRKSWKEEL
jgi:hypothetical protein